MLFGELSTVAKVHLLSFSLLDTVNHAYETEYHKDPAISCLQQLDKGGHGANEPE